MTAATDPVTTLPGIGPKMELVLARLGIENLLDMALHLPSQYQDRKRVIPLAELKDGDECVTDGQIEGAQVQFGRRRMLLVRVRDGNHGLVLRFFHFTGAQQKRFEQAGRVRLFGTMRLGNQSLECVHPEYQLYDDVAPALAESLTPVYPLCEGLTQVRLRKLTEQALDRLADTNLELIPPAVLPDTIRQPLLEALRSVHRPLAQDQTGQVERSAQRVKIEELVAHRLAMRRRRQYREDLRAPVLDNHQLAAEFLAALPFRPTAGQQAAIREIQADLAQRFPMRRLLQGDVGCGKTVVAAAAACSAVRSGFQVAVMAPTELLAEQLARTLGDWLQPLGCPVAYLSGRNTERARRPVLAGLADGSVPLIVGTHALFQSSVEFRQLGLVIIDEQHRFGVAQRLALADKGAGAGTPHQLIMTATPIPRTLSMSFYGDIDFTSIRELPPGRTPVQTIALSVGRRNEVIERIAGACEAGRQAYWVCTLIEDSENLQAQAAEDAAELLTAELPGLRIGLIHGRMKSAERLTLMQAFRDRQIDILVATTVIEVGVDVPNASLMIIENAERLGLSQLHQLRGRVGRGAQESFCVLLYQPPLGRTARRRIDIMRETQDGFRIAEEDLQLRGPGDPLGTRQAGDLQFRIADPLRDAALLPLATRIGDTLWSQHPDRVEGLVERWLPARGRLHEA